MCCCSYWTKATDAFVVTGWRNVTKGAAILARYSQEETAVLYLREPQSYLQATRMGLETSFSINQTGFGEKIETSSKTPKVPQGEAVFVWNRFSILISCLKVDNVCQTSSHHLFQIYERTLHTNNFCSFILNLRTKVSVDQKIFIFMF